MSGGCQPADGPPDRVWITAVGAHLYRFNPKLECAEGTIVPSLQGGGGFCCLTPATCLSSSVAAPGCAGHLLVSQPRHVHWQLEGRAEARPR